jgi:hypothetical protein
MAPFFILTKEIIMKFLKIAISTLLISGCSGPSEPDIEISVNSKDGLFGPMVLVNIQAISDEVLIKDLVINRGNCPLLSTTVDSLNRKPTLKFGQTYQGLTNRCRLNDIIEIDVTTDEGTFSFSFD